MKIKSVTPIEPRPALCIEVDSPDRLFAVGASSEDQVVTHNSVAQRNILFGAIMRPDRWRVLCIDLKRVELSSYRAYSNVVMGVATTLSHALLVLRFAQETMMKRYTEMEELGVQNFLELPEAGQALLVMVDEAGELLSGGGGGAKTDDAKEEEALKGEASLIMGSILRLGRAAGVHLIAATQRPDATLLPGEQKANMAVRLNCGFTDGNASSMILGSGEGTRVRAYPPGRLYLSINGNGNHAQGFFAKPSWIDDWLSEKGLNPDGTPKITPRKRPNLTMEEVEETLGLDADAFPESSSTATGAPQVAGYPLGESPDDYEDEEDWGFEEPAAPPAHTESRPLLVDDSEGEVVDKWHRPEDDWDSTMESIVEANQK